MDTVSINAYKDGLVSVHTSWECKSLDRKLDDIASLVTSTSNAVDLTEVYTGASWENGLVYLEQVEEASPCSLSLQCAPHSSALITSLLIVSEARTMEVYSGSGEYCGTCRGELQHTVPIGSANEGISLYKKHLKLESQSTSCDIKLLSLGGRTRVGIGGIVLGLQDDETASSSSTAGPGIDLQRVQSMMESMGATLSPGAQNLMDMVQFQQKNKTDVLGGFLPLLLGGGPLAALAKAGSESRAAGDIGPQAPASHRQMDTSSPAQLRETDSTVSGVKPHNGPSCPSAPLNDSKLTNRVSSLLNGQPGRKPIDFGPELLPLLQGVCGQVTQLRIEDKSSESTSSAWLQEEQARCRALEQRMESRMEEMEQKMERRMEEMEQRLKQHIDQRLDALQQSLERALLMALPLAHDRGVKGTPVPDWHNPSGLMNGNA
ncbi:hypothetical protein AGOR_G00201130 [Albula goreensis]|uniref:Uncharacterized protein n=1 Tax=Albula goreensis TaxID=1534307 RepID=A0A8T3CP75_9TELE|nr:hypothetical protein AGOR_G00201130 [Albula goreensis]